MKWFYDLKIAHKLNAAFLVVLVFIVGLGGFAIAQLGQVNQSSTDIAATGCPA
jgi:methyl-accepting chemotaxis protein